MLLKFAVKAIIDHCEILELTL